jgi:hypothetical protein
VSRLTPRGRALRWLTRHRGITEQPAGSNRDQRADGITAAQRRLAGWLVGKAWCAIWHLNALIAAGVAGARNPALAGVATIEDYARARKAPYGRGWVTPAERGWHKHVLRGDAVVLFGRGVHMETVRSVAWVYRKLGLIRTDGGNTSSGNAGDQANGGGAFPRWRPITVVRGFALVDYPDH